MRNFFIFLSILSGFFSLATGYLAIKKFNFIIKNEITIGDMLTSSLLTGVSGSLFFLTIINIVGLLDKNRSWSIDDFGGWIIISLCFGGILAIGGTVQTLWVSGYKNVLFKILRKKIEKKDKQE